MQSVRLHDILFKVYPVQDSTNRVHPIHHQEAQPYQVASSDNQQQQQRHNPESNTHTPHVPREALSPLAEVEKQEHHRRDKRINKKIHIDKRLHLMVHIHKRQQHRNRVQPRDAINAIHKVIRIHNTDKHDITNNHSPPRIHSKHIGQVKSATHSQQMKQQPYFLSQATHIIPEAHPRHQRNPDKKPHTICRRIKHNIQKGSKPINYATPSNCNIIVRTPLVGLVNNVEPVHNPEIKQLRHNKQSKNYNVNHKISSFPSGAYGPSFTSNITVPLSSTSRVCHCPAGI